MILLAHILIATASLIYTAYLLFTPSASKLHIAYGLIAGTFVSGFYLVFTNPTHITQTCETGLVYLAFVSIGIVIARNKLAVKAN